MTLTEAAAWVTTTHGTHCKPRTVRGWILSGLTATRGGRVRLRAVRVGGVWAVAERDLAAFFAALGDQPAPPPRDSGANARLAAAGW